MSTQGELNSPCAQVLFPNGHYSYAFGNTPAVELTEHFGTWKLEDTLNILFLGVGDIRNLLFTVSELYQRSEDAVPKRLRCHLNDFDLSVLARDVIILESVCSIDPCCDHDVDFLWNIWYNLALSRADSKRLQEMMKTLASQENAKGNVKFGSRTVFEECQEIWKDWLHQELNIEEATFQRRKVMLSGLNLLCPDVDSDVEHEQDTFATAASSLAVNTIKQLFTTTDETKLGVKCLQTSGSCYQEVFSYFLTGCTSRIHSDSELNPTLVRPFEHKWKVHYGSCPYDGYIPINRNLFEKFKSIAKSCKEILRSWVTHFQRYSPKITVTFWGGDALELCRDGLPRDLLFDVVDTSNLSDHVGLLNILVCCARRLKKPGESQLITSTMLWRSAGLTNLEDYLQSSLGIQQNTYPTILGLHFAEDLNLGKSDILSIKKSQRIEDRLVWVKTALERSPINLVRSPDILGALKSMADRCFKLPCHRSRSLQLCGASLSSPLTFFLAFRQVADIFQESAEQVLSYVEEALPTVRLFQKRSRFNICGLTWNVLKRLAGLLKGAIMKITVPVTFPSFPRITPVIQAVLFEDPADARFLSTWPVTQMKQRTFHRPVHLFYNNVHFDPAKGIATLFMLESDWEGLHMDTILLLISSSVSCTSGAVHLKRHCHFKEARGNMHVAFAKNGDDIEVRDTHARKSILRSKRRKSRDLARNLSCVRSVSCIVFNQKSKDLQKFDSSYGLDNLPMQDLNTGNSSNVHNSTDCLLSSENIVTHFYQTGISSPCFQLRAGAPVGTDVTDETLELESDCEAVTSAEPVDDNIQSFGSLDVTFMTLQPVKADHLELLVLEEHALCYNAEILIWRPFPKANHTVKYYPREMPTTVEISFGENRVPLKLSFSCPVDEKSCKVQVLEDRKQLRCHFRKSEFGVIGRACIKRPPIMDLSSLSTWSKKDDIRALISYATYEGEEVSEEKEAFMELQKTLCCIVASFLEKPEQDNCFYIVHSLETEEQTPNLTVVTQAVHCRKQAPLIKVLFCDHSLTAFSSEAVGNSTIVAKFKEVLIPRMTKNQSSPMIQSTKQGQALLKRLLYSNAKRMIQPERLKPVWIQSFLQLRF